MIRIAKLTDYAMLILTQLARDPAVIVSTTVLAEVLYLSTPTVSKILKMLSDAGLVTSIRGAEGGYRLVRSPETITVMDVIAAMEGDLAMTACCESTSLCAIDHVCTMRENWRKINGMVGNLLTGFSLLDMIDPLFLIKHIEVEAGAAANDK